MKKKTVLLSLAGSVLTLIQFFKYYSGHFVVPSGQNAYTHSFEYAGYVLGYNIFAILGLASFIAAYKFKKKYGQRKS